MKKTLKKALSLVLAAATGLCVFGCAKENQKNDGVVNLSVMFFDGGYGSVWLEKAAREFETMYKDYTVGDKTGVKIELRGTRETGQNIYDSYELMTNDIFFTEQNLNYYNFVNKNYLVDLTDVLTESPVKDANGNVLQNHSVLSAMDEDLKDYYGVGTTDKKYYAVPLGSSFCGLIYDEEFFFNNGLFLTKEYDEAANASQAACIKPDAGYTIGNITAKNADGEYYTVNTEGDKKYRVTNADEKGKTYTLSMGPDGIYGTYDDGQPRTYAEFFNLCAYMKTYKSVYPFIMMGEGDGYVNWFLDQLFADYEGYEQTMLNFTFNGTAKNLISVDDEGNVTKLPEVEMNPQASTREEKLQNAEITKSAGRYHALKFFENMVEADGGGWLHPDWNKNSSQFDAQRDFMLSIKEGNDKAAFLIDGTWWQEEANFDSLVKHYGDKYAKENRQFKYFSLPKASLDKVGEERLVLDTGYLSAYVLSKTSDEKKELAKKFVQYCFTDAKNKEYTQITGVPRAFDYEFTAEEYDSFSSFGKSLWDMVKSGNAKIAYPQSQSKYYLDMALTLQPAHYFDTLINNAQYKNMKFENVQEVIKEKNISSEIAFRGIYEYNKDRY